MGGAGRQRRGRGSICGRGPLAHHNPRRPPTRPLGSATVQPLCPSPARYEHCLDHCTHGDTCAATGCTAGRRRSGVHLLVGAVLPLLRRLESMRSRGKWGR